MRRGQVRKPLGDTSAKFTKRDLVAASGLSAKTFDSIRKAARVRGPGHGGLDWEFSADDVAALIHRAESGQWSQRGAPAAQAWRQMLDEARIGHR